MTIATRFSKSWAVPKFDIKDPSLVLYLPLWFPYSDMTGSTIYSYDGNRHVGTVTGATWGSQGRTFDGLDDNIDCGSSSVLNPTEAITIEIWLKLTTTVANQPLDFPNICEKGDGTGAERAYVIYLNRGGGTLVFQIDNQTAVSVSIAGWTADEWHHVMATYDQVNELLYIDGGAPTSQALTTAIPVKNFYFGVGRAYPIQGTVGEVRIYSRALSAGEIRRNYQVTKWRYT